MHAMNTTQNDLASEHDDVWPPFRALCVDDNCDCADSAALLLRVMGFEAVACYDGAAALSLNDRFHPGLCFIDLNMPRMAGDELAIKLRNGTGWRPLLLIAVTAMSNEESCTRIKTAGFDRHFIKPVDPAQLMEVVDLYL
jgi:two-component system, OmpR family, response regulator